jgi:Mg2+-importing ATPase
VDAAERVTTGLTSVEAAERLERFGANDPAPKHERSVVVSYAILFTNPLVLILLFAAIASAFLGDVPGATIIVVVVLIGVTTNFAQTYRSERAATALRERVAPTATLMRDGAWSEVPQREVVPGDRLRLAAGDLVPADATLVAARDLHLQEAALTGESFPVERAKGEPILLGTSVVSGTGEAVVDSTGVRTKFGELASRLAAPAPPTEFDRGIRQFGMLIMRAVVFLVLFILVVNLAFHRNAMQSLLFAVALAVGLTPEFLPMITSVTLAKSAVALAREKVIVKKLAAMQNLGGIDVLCSDKTGTLTTGAMALVASVDAFGVECDRAAELAALNSAFETGIRSPLDGALLAARPGAGDGWEKRDEVPFDFERRRVSIVVRRDGACLLVTKGAPEAIVELAKMSDEDRARARATYAELQSRGHRVLAVASRTVDDCAAYGKDDECELDLAGFVAFADPPRADAKNAVSALAADGVRVVVLTGDGDVVARHVCTAVGIDATEVLLGDDLVHMTEGALEHAVERVNVFARVSPAQKNQIVLALKRRSHVVGFLGDGINDAPSLHAADVGISVSNAVDVARAAADVILLEQGLHVLHIGILHGRRAFGNVTKYLLMGTSSNFGNMLSMAGATLVLPFLPMLPGQILFNNLLYDVSQLTIPTDRVDESYLRRPQKWDVRFIQRFMLFIGPVSSLYDFLTFFVLIRFFHASEVEFHTGWFVESIATQTLVIFVIRTFENPFASRPSRALVATTLTIVAAACAIPYTPMGPWIGFVPLPASYFAFLAGATLTYLAIVEVVKRVTLTRRPT